MPPLTFDDVTTGAKPSGGALTFDDLAPKSPGSGYDTALAAERKAIDPETRASLPIWQGATFGQGIDIDSTLQRAETLGENVVHRVRGEKVPYTSDDAARAVETGEREAVSGVRARHPAASLATELGGGIMTTLASGGRAPAEAAEAAAPRVAAEVTPMFSRVLQSALKGAGIGALTGEGEAGGDAGHRAGGAATGGAFGGAFGGATTLSEPILQGLFRGANRLAQGAGLKGWQSAANMAEERLRDALRQDRVTPAKIEAAIKEWKDVGVGAAKLIDVAGENTMGLVRAASSRFGPARSVAAHNAMSERTNLGPEGQERAALLTPKEARAAPAVRQSLTEERDSLAETEYRPAYAKPVQVTPPLMAELADQDGRSAVTAAIKGARARKDYETVKSLQTLQGALEAVSKIDPKMPPAVRAAAIQKYLTKVQVSGGAVDAVRRAFNTLGGATKNAEVAAGYFGRAHGIDDVLDQVPELQAARATYHAMSDKIRGLDLGEAALTKPTSAFSQLLKTAGGKGKSPKPMTPQMLEQARTGARQWIQDALGGKATAARAAMEKIATGKDVQRNLEALFGPEEAQRYIRDAQLRIHRLTRAQDISPRTGSQTQPRAQDIMGMLHGWRGMAGKLLGDITGSGMDEKEAEAIVRAGLGDPLAMARSLTARQPVLRQALRRTVPVVSSQAARTVSQPAE